MQHRKQILAQEDKFKQTNELTSERKTHRKPKKGGPMIPK